MKKRFIVSILLVFVVVILAILFIKKGFIKKEDSLTSESDLPTISVSIPPASAQSLINGAIINQKLDIKYGYKLNLVIEQPQNYITSLVTNRSQIIPLSPSDFIELKNNGQDIRMFGTVLKMYCPFVAKNTFVVIGNEPLKGKKVAIVKQPSGPYSFLDTLMKDRSEKLTEYFKVVETDLLSLPILLSRGDVDASNMCNIVSVAKMLSQNQYKIIGSTEEMIKQEFPETDGIPLLGLVSQNEWLTNNQPLAKAYLLSQKEALDYLSNNLDEAIGATGSGNIELSSSEAAMLSDLINENTYFSFPDWEKTVKDIQIFLGRDFDQSYFVTLP